jgi:hypothetical protein
MRIWLSGPRILGGLLRPGISLNGEDLRRMRGRPARLPKWRRYELRHGLQEAAKARGEKLTKEDCDYAIDKGLATGLLDKNGNLNFVARGSREEIVEEILSTAKVWGKDMTYAEAEATADAAIRAIEKNRRDGIAILIALVAWAVAFGVIVATIFS